jgi:hypothetical protein
MIASIAISATINCQRFDKNAASAIIGRFSRARQ